ncbi:BQ5605_C009g05743 [Microbotryum silenes-dioicae]|uniref:BQ5605_C009g05743 protein n=1 Tax=Microbotryum silenes-dioicae TaxID=796604 RepID=A0A2X0MHG8_9BASI|nr:BQ5605_C009g05743 [Microbotryum silenes-dioicae]
MDEDEEEDQLPGRRAQRASTRRSTRETSFLSITSISSRTHHDDDDDESFQLDDDDDDDDDDARSTSTASLTPRKRLIPASRTLPTTATNKTWSTNLRLEPKRVAVMQASFFQQQASSPVAAEEQAPTRKNSSTWTIRGSAAAASTSQKPTTASTFKAAPASAPAPAPAPAPSSSVVPTPAIDPSPFRPYRKYTRVPLDRSITKGKEGNLVDLGLALGRSFRVGWSPTGQIFHLGRGNLYRGENVDKSDALKVDNLKTTLSTDMRSAVRLLKIQLAHTPIYSNPVDSSNDEPSSSIPFAVPHPELRFTHFVNEFASSDRSAEANLWRLGQALFDEIQDLAIPENVVVNDPNVQGYVERLRRTDRFERWLREVVRGEVEDDLRNVGGDGLGASDEEAVEAKKIFSLLSGHQVERACQAAIQAGDLRLATLLAQAGGDEEFRRDVFLQLVKWREYRVDSHILPEYRKIYELLCGNVGVSEGKKGKDGDSVVDGVEEVHVAQGLGWKRAFGLSLWYATFRSSIETAMELYESAFEEDPRVAKPEPEYIATPTRSTSTEKRPEWSNRSGETPTDPLYQLLKLFTLSTHPLEQVLLPINFGTCPLDYRLPWHLYILLSRVLRRRDFDDRIQVVDFEDRGMDDGDDGRGFLEGNSVRADLMTEAYANQLEMNGEWTWSAFVLLHLELPIARLTSLFFIVNSRAKALQALLSRSTHLLTSETFTFLTEKLRIPLEWIHHAQALATTDRFEKFGLHLLAREWNEAHRLVKEQLGPEAVLRGDLDLLRRLCGRFDEEKGWKKVEGWEEGAGLLKEYAEVLEGEKRWLERVREGADADAEEGESEERGRKIRSLLEMIARLGSGHLRSRKAKVARDEMMSRLTLIATRVNEALNKIQPKTLQESDRLVWIRGAADNFLTQSLQAACS